MFSIPEYRTYRDRTQPLSGVMAYSVPWTVTLGGGEPREIEVLLVTCNYFDVLRLLPSVGTGFAANCDAPNAPPQALLSHALWTRDFNGDRDIVGKGITINGHDVTVAGVAPEGFDGTDIMKAALFAPTSLIRLVRPEENYSDNPQASWLTIIGRRKAEPTSHRCAPSSR
jgi:hypothetical protein